MCPLVISKQRIRIDPESHIELKDLQACKRVYGDRITIEALELTMRGLRTYDAIESLLQD
jgi:hypothetical protein